MKIYIQSNRYQQIAAKVSSETFNSFGLSSKIVCLEDFKEITKFFGSTYLRKGKKTIFKDDLQSFTLLRFLIPEISKSKSPIMIVDPDIFAIKDPASILRFFKNDNQIYCTFINYKPRTEMMVLNPKTKFWEFDKIIHNLFNLKIDYDDLFNLRFLNNEIICKLDNRYNSLDEINDQTVLLHTTNRKTQPWKEGLKIDYEIHSSKLNIIYNNFKKIFGLEFNRNIVGNRYEKHPDLEVTKCIVNLFNKALITKSISKEEVIDLLEKKYISQNFFKKLNI